MHLNFVEMNEMHDFFLWFLVFSIHMTSVVASHILIVSRIKNRTYPTPRRHRSTLQRHSCDNVYYHIKDFRVDSFVALTRFGVAVWYGHNAIYPWHIMYKTSLFHTRRLRSRRVRIAYNFQWGVVYKTLHTKSNRCTGYVKKKLCIHARRATFPHILISKFESQLSFVQ